MLHTIKSYVKRNYLFMITIIIMSLIAHIFFINNQFRNGLFMVGPSDQLIQMQIFKDFLYDEFTNGNFFYSFNYNGGDNFFARLSYYYSTSILYYLTVLFTFILETVGVIGEPTMVYWAYIALFISLFRSIIILIITTKYIEVFEVKRPVALLGASFYAFSNIYFRHVVLWEFFADAMIWLPIILYGVEKIIRGHKGTIFSVGLALTLFNNGYFAYVNLLITVVYILLRMVFKLANSKEIPLSKQIKRYLVYGLAGIGIGMPGFIMFIKGFLQTSRLDAETNAKLFNTTFELGNLLLSDGVQLVPMYFIFMIFIISNYKNKNFVYFSLLSIGLIILKFSPFIASMFNGFSAPQYRWHYITFLFIGVTISIATQNLLNNKINKSMIFQLILSFISTFILYIIAFKNNINNIYNKKIVLFILMSYLLVSLVIFFVKNKKGVRLLLSISFLLSIYFVVGQNKQLFEQYDLESVNYNTLYREYDDPNLDYTNALKIVEKDTNDFNRIDYHQTINLGIQKGVNTFNVYSSFHNGYQQEFYRYFNVKNIRDNNNYVNGFGGRQILNSLFQVDYILATNEEKYILPTSYSKIDNINELNIYKNTLPLSFIHPVKSLYSYEDLGKNDYKDELLIDGAIVPEEYSNSELPKNYKKSLDYNIEQNMYYNDGIIESDNEPVKIDIFIENQDEFKDLMIDYTLIPINDTKDSHFMINDNKIYTKSLNNLYSSQLTRHQVHIPYDGNVVFEFPGNSNYQFIIHKIIGVTHDKLEKRSELDKKLNYIYDINEDSIKIEFDNEHNFPFMVLPIFYDDGWQLKINNKPAEIINTNNGMIGFKIPLANDDVLIELKFKQTGFVFVTIISILSDIFLLLDYKKQYGVD